MASLEEPAVSTLSIVIAAITEHSIAGHHNYPHAYICHSKASREDVHNLVTKTLVCYYDDKDGPIANQDDESQSSIKEPEYHLEGLITRGWCFSCGDRVYYVVEFGWCR